MIIVYVPEIHKFLADDEKSWTANIDEAAVFTDIALASDIAARELKDNRDFRLFYIPE